MAIHIRVAKWYSLVLFARSTEKCERCNRAHVASKLFRSAKNQHFPYPSYFYLPTDYNISNWYESWSNDINR